MNSRMKFGFVCVCLCACPGLNFLPDPFLSGFSKLVVSLT